MLPLDNTISMVSIIYSLTMLILSLTSIRGKFFYAKKERSFEIIWFTATILPILGLIPPYTYTISALVALRILVSGSGGAKLVEVFLLVLIIALALIINSNQLLHNVAQARLSTNTSSVGFSRWEEVG